MVWRNCVRKPARTAAISYCFCGHGTITLFRTEVRSERNGYFGVTQEEFRLPNEEYDREQKSLDQVRQIAAEWLWGKKPREIATPKCETCLYSEH